MEADFFSILRLRPGRYSPTSIDRQYRSVRREILRGGGSDCQRKLDDAMIAHTMLRNSRRQAQLVHRSSGAARPAGVRVHAPRTRKQHLAKALRLVASKSTPIVAQPVDESVYGRFARMVLAHVESGLLRFTARARLMMLAKGLGIGEFKANLIIAEVLHDLHEGRVAAPAPVSPVATAATSRPSYLGVWIVLAAALAGLIDSALLFCLR